MKKMGLKKKLFLFLSFCMVVPALLLQVWFYFDSASKTKELFFEKIKNISLSKEIIIEHYFDSLSDNLKFIVVKESLVSAFKEMQESYSSYLEELGPYDFEKIKKEVAFFYKNEFLEKYNKENPSKKIESVDFLLEKMQEKQILLQYYYIVKNANKIGQKDKLLTAETKTKFDLLHEKIHQDYKSFLEKFSLYDLFFIEAETGVILYSVFKELDFATSVTVGPYAESGIGEIFKKLSENSKKGEKKTIFQDLSLYFPSYNAPAGFMGVPVYEKEKFLGVVVLQLPIEKLNQIMESEEKNEALDFYVVGQDFLPRVDAKLDKEKKNVVSAFKDVENGKILNSVLKKSFESNKVEYAEEKNYIGEEALQVALPMNIYENNWRVVVSLNKKEMNAQLQALSFKFIIQIVLIALASFVVALFLTRPLSMEMQKIEEMLSQEVLAVKQQSLVMTEISHKLSSASHEQAAGLQETVASVDEISAMIARNADSADNSSKTSQKSTQTAQEGKAKVENMLKAIDSIAENNQGIVKQIEHSNEEISTIVEVIQEISGKTKIINDIVFQTKLLSFNASVEAARAGEHGKGFAVVAEEVGNLASMSGKASTEISALLEKSVKRVTEIVDSSKGLMKNLVATSREKIEIGHESAKSCASSLDQILQNVSSVDEMVKEIATASREQAAGVSEINKAMSELDQVTQANSSLAQESSTVAEKLNKQTQLFSEIVQRLKDFLEGANSNSSITPVKKTATVKEKKKEIKKTKETKVKNVEKQDNVIALKPAQENQKSVVEKVEKKVVGLEFDETPLANDSRFEDI